MTVSSATSALILIGNEILSGRTQDKNLNFIAKELAEIGVKFMEVRVIPDIPETIVDTVNELRARYDYVFTTGGIGPTHDDITSECISKAFGVKHERNKEAEQILLKHYAPDQVNEARMRMADMPEGARLIPNPLTSAPGFAIGNVYVMAGVPVIMQAMFSSIKGELKVGPQIKSVSIATNLREGDFAIPLGAIQKKHPDTDIGSYPAFGTDADYTVGLVVKGVDDQAIKNAAEEIRGLLLSLGGTFKDLK